MLTKFREGLRRTLNDPAGQRFQLRYRRQRRTPSRTVAKVLLMSGGGGLVVVGLFFMLVPGPGIPIVALGGALLANESLAIARLLDAMEVRLRRLYARVRGRKPPRASATGRRR